MTYKFELADRSLTFGTPIEGVWYAGVNHLGEVGAIAKYENGEFSNSSGVVNMRFYEFLRRASVKTAHTGKLPSVAHALRWLETLINSPAVTWDPDQKAAAQEALDRARAAI